MEASEIERLCDEWCSASSTEDGATVVGQATEQHRLHANGVVFHELNMDALKMALIGTTRVLVRSGMNTIVHYDHYLLWSWCAELILSSSQRYFQTQEYEIKSLWEASVRAALSSLKKPAKSKEEWQQQVDIENTLPHHAKYYLQSSHVALAYLAFPLLEATVKRACKQYVGYDGKVVKKFEVRKKDSSLRIYKRGQLCSSLRDLLFQLRDKVASSELAADIVKFEHHICVLEPGSEAFDTIYNWRNRSLHGETNFQTLGGALLSLSFLIALEEFRNDYDDTRGKVFEHCKWEMQSGHRSPWSYYPPI